MRQRSSIDPELSTLRSVANGAGRHRPGIETSRFALYAAFEAQNADDARRWASALRAALLAAGIDHEDFAELRSLGLAALDKIEQAI